MTPPLPAFAPPGSLRRPHEYELPPETVLLPTCPTCKKEQLMAVYTGLIRCRKCGEHIVIREGRVADRTKARGVARVNGRLLWTDEAA